ERQYCSPGINLPMGCFMRTPHGEFTAYHTSADNPDLVQSSALSDSLAKALAVIDVIDNNAYYFNLKPFCEPKLGNYGLYKPTGGLSANLSEKALLWLLNLSDGQHSLLDIASRSNLPWPAIKDAAQALSEAGLLKPADRPR